MKQLYSRKRGREREGETPADAGDSQSGGRG